MYAALETAGISTQGQRGYHLLWNAALHGLICFATTTDKEQTFALLEEWVALTPEKTRDEALAVLAWRYFSSRAPVTVQDFIWWSGLSAADARSGFEAIKSSLIQEKVGKLAYWMPTSISEPQVQQSMFALPGFDEYLLGYKDRSAVLDAAHAEKICPGGNGMFAATMLIDGRVAGTWKRTLKKSGIEIVVTPFTTLSKIDEKRFVDAANRYGEFHGMPVQVS